MRAKLWWWVLPVLTVLLFSPVYRAAFVYDDADFIVDNPLLTAPRLDVAAVFTTAYPPQHPEQKLYRPLVTLSYALDKVVCNKPGWFHVTNVPWHLAVVALLVVLLRQLSTPPTGTLLAAAAWLAWHPLTTEAVAWVAGRAELMAAFFVLASLMAFVRNRPVLAGLAFAAALLCKESAIMTPVLAALLAWRWPAKSHEHEIKDNGGRLCGAESARRHCRAWQSASGPTPLRRSGRQHQPNSLNCIRWPVWLRWDRTRVPRVAATPLC